MRPIVDYQILLQADPAKMMEAVRMAIATGWEPYGPLTLAPLMHASFDVYPAGMGLLQVIVRYGSVDETINTRIT